MVRQYPTNSISKTTLKEQLLRLKDKKALTDPHIIRLLQSTRHTGAVIPFSPFRKAFLRSNIFATIAEKGWPAFFVTLNPNDVSSPLVKLQNTKRFTKEQLFNLFSGMSNENTGNEEWSQFSGGANGSNPVSCADYFHSIVKLFIEVFLGFDSKTKSYAPSVFGMVTDYFGVVEEQQRKQLHIHMLIWVDGLEDYEFVHSTFEDIPYKKRLLEYLDSIISCYKSEIESPIGSPCTWQCPKLDPGNITHEYSKQLNWVQSWVQNHSCSRYHCMKKQKRCRYNFPKEPVQETVYNSNKKTIYLKRNDMYLNPCFAPVAIVARFNTDIRFIPCLDKPQISRYLAYYISNYTSKHEATNLHLVDFMNKKIADYEKFNPDILENSNDLFRGLLMKTLNKFSACNNVGSVTAASCLLNYPDHYCGNHYQIINWKGWDIWLCKELGDNYRLHSYNRLTNHTFYYRVLGFGIQNDSSNASIQENTTLVSFFQEYLARNAQLHDLSLYELHAEYCFLPLSREDVGEADYICTNVINNNNNAYIFCHRKRILRSTPTLPGFNTKSRLHGVGTEAFSRIMILLFRPFTAINQFSLGIYADYRSYFNDFYENMPHTNSAKNIIRNIMKDAEVAIEASNFQHPENPIEPAMFLQNSERGMIQWQIVRYHLSDPEGDFFPSLDLLDDVPVTTYQNVHSIILQQSDFDSNRTNRIENAIQLLQPIRFNTRAILKDKINQYLRNQKTDKTCQNQWDAVRIFANHVLDLITGLEPKPLRMLVHGEGGTGKSFIINTMVGLLEALNLKDRVCVCAPTGKAAVNVKGDTIDGLFGLSRVGNILGRGNTANTGDTPVYDTSPLHRCSYLIVDEISMVGKERLADMHDKLGLNVGHENSDHILGNKSFIFFGDFLQFPPVGKTCIIVKETFSNTTNSLQTRKQKLGTMIFNSIEHVIELIDQKRQDDTEYLALLRAMRNQTVTQEHVNFLNSRCKFGSYEDHSNDWLVETPFVVTLNREKTHWNKRLVQAYSEVHQRNIVKIQAIDWIQRDLNSPSSSTHLNSIDLKLLSEYVVDNCLQYELSLVIGMTLVVLENIYKQLGVVNGAEVVLQKIHYDNRMNPIALEVLVSNVEFHIESLPPSTVWIERKKTSSSFTKLDGTKVQIQRNQFPVTEGFASTAHKKQGSTLQRAVISLANGRGVASYVKLSRTKRASDTFILGEVSLNDLKINPPNGWSQFKVYISQRKVWTSNFAATLTEIEALH